MHLKDHLLQGFLYWSVADAGVWGEKVYRDGSTSCVWLSSSTLPPRLPFFPPKAFPTIFSSLLFPCTTSLQPTAVFTLTLLSCPCPAPSHFFSFASFILPTFSWIYILLSGGQGLLPALRWYSVRSSALEDLVPMYPWRDVYSTSTYSSVIFGYLF